MSDPQPTTKRRIVTRSVTFEMDAEHATPVAVCPRRLSVLPVEQCGECSDFVKLCVNPESGSPFMCCAFNEAPFVHAAEGNAEHASALLGSEPLCIADVMTAPEHCVHLDVTLGYVLGEVLADAEFAPVIDEAGRAVGLITKADVLQRLNDRARSEQLRHTTQVDEADESAITVRDMMLSSTFMVSPDASVGQVAAMMAYERVQSVLVVDAARVLLGTVSALDLARWLACRLGYVVPAQRES